MNPSSIGRMKAGDLARALKTVPETRLRLPSCRKSLLRVTGYRALPLPAAQFCLLFKEQVMADVA